MLPGELHTRYKVRAELGRGSFGVVFRVHDGAAGVDRALKLLEVQGDGAREAREIAVSLQLDHPHLVRFHDGGVVGRHAYLVMDLADGSLEDALPDAPRAWSLLRQAASGVAQLHRAGLVHRDLKPENILVMGGSARVGDLGLVRGGAHQTLTATGTIMGSPVWMAPEQARGERPTAASDAWALGVIAYQIVEGAPPYPDLSMGELLARVARGQRDPLQRGRAHLTSSAVAAIDAALDPDPARRPTDLVGWAKALGELAAAPAAPVAIARTQVVEDAAPGSTQPIGPPSPPPPESPTEVLGTPGLSREVAIAPRGRPPPSRDASASASPGSDRRPWVVGVLALGLLFGVLWPRSADAPPPSAQVPPTPAGPPVSPRGEEPRSPEELAVEAHRELRRTYLALTETWVRSPGRSRWAVGQEVPCDLVFSYESEDFRRKWLENLDGVLALARAVAAAPDVALPPKPALGMAGGQLVYALAKDVANRRNERAEPTPCMGRDNLEEGAPYVPGELDVAVPYELLRSSLARLTRALEEIAVPPRSPWRARLALLRLNLARAENCLRTDSGRLREEDLETTLADLRREPPALSPRQAWSTLLRLADELPCERRAELAAGLAEGLRYKVPHPEAPAELWILLVDAWEDCPGRRESFLDLAGTWIQAYVGDDVPVSPAAFLPRALLWLSWMRELRRPPHLPAQEPWATYRRRLEGWILTRLAELEGARDSLAPAEASAWGAALADLRERWDEDRGRRKLHEWDRGIPEDIREFHARVSRRLRALARSLAVLPARAAGSRPAPAWSAAREAYLASHFDWTDGLQRGYSMGVVAQVGVAWNSTLPCEAVAQYRDPDWRPRLAAHLEAALTLAREAIAAGATPAAFEEELVGGLGRLMEVYDNDLGARIRRGLTGGDCTLVGGKVAGRTVGDLAETTAREHRAALKKAAAGAAARLGELLEGAPAGWQDMLAPERLRLVGVAASTGAEDDRRVTEAHLREAGDAAAGALLDRLEGAPAMTRPGPAWHALTRWVALRPRGEGCELCRRALVVAGTGLGAVQHVPSRQALAGNLLAVAQVLPGGCDPADAPPMDAVAALLDHLAAAPEVAPGSALLELTKAWTKTYERPDRYREVLVAPAWGPTRARHRRLLAGALAVVAEADLAGPERVLVVKAARDFRKAVRARGGDRFLSADGLQPHPAAWTDAEKAATSEWRDDVLAVLEAMGF